MHPAVTLPPPPFTRACGTCTSLLHGLADAFAAPGRGWTEQLAVARHIAADHPSEVPPPHDDGCEICAQYAGEGVGVGLDDVHLPRFLAGDRVEVRSTGSNRGTDVNPAAVEAIVDVGIDISAEVPKMPTVDAVKESDVCTTMGCGDTCPVFPGRRYLD